MGADLTPEALQGHADVLAYPSRGNQYYESSDCWLAWEAGAHLARLGYPPPVRATKARGYAVNVVTDRSAPFSRLFTMGQNFTAPHLAP